MALRHRYTVSTTTPSRPSAAYPVPVDLRERMRAVNVRGTNLDPNSAPVTAEAAPLTLDERKERARAYARAHRAKQKAERERLAASHLAS